MKLTENYFAGGSDSGAGAHGPGTRGAFKLDFCPETPAYYLLIPGAGVEMLAELDLRLARDRGVSGGGRTLLECDGWSARVRARGVVAAGRL